MLTLTKHAGGMQLSSDTMMSVLPDILDFVLQIGDLPEQKA